MIKEKIFNKSCKQNLFQKSEYLVLSERFCSLSSEKTTDFIENFVGNMLEFDSRRKCLVEKTRISYDFCCKNLVIWDLSRHLGYERLTCM